MIDIFLAVMAVAFAQTGSGSAGPSPSGPSVAEIAPAPDVVAAPQKVPPIPETLKPDGAAASGGPVPPPAATGPAIDETVVPAGLTADPQTPTGRFTTAAEVRPILEATKGNWVAVRAFDGSDLLYVTHLWSWRCGLKAIAISINAEALQNWPLPPCRPELTSPAAILDEDGPPYLRLRLGSVETVTIQLVYDDLSRDIVQFDRQGILIP